MLGMSEFTAGMILPDKVDANVGGERKESLSAAVAPKAPAPAPVPTTPATVETTPATSEATSKIPQSPREEFRLSARLKSFFSPPTKAPSRKKIDISSVSAVTGDQAVQVPAPVFFPKVKIEIRPEHQAMYNELHRKLEGLKTDVKNPDRTSTYVPCPPRAFVKRMQTETPDELLEEEIHKKSLEKEIDEKFLEKEIRDKFLNTIVIYDVSPEDESLIEEAFEGLMRFEENLTGEKLSGETPKGDRLSGETLIGERLSGETVMGEKVSEETPTKENLASSSTPASTPGTSPSPSPKSPEAPSSPSLKSLELAFSPKPPRISFSPMPSSPTETSLSPKPSAPLSGTSLSPTPSASSSNYLSPPKPFASSRSSPSSMSVVPPILSSTPTRALGSSSYTAFVGSKRQVNSNKPSQRTSNITSPNLSARNISVKTTTNKPIISPKQAPERPPRSKDDDLTEILSIMRSRDAAKMQKKQVAEVNRVPANKKRLFGFGEKQKDSPNSGTKDKEPIAKFFFNNGREGDTHQKTSIEIFEWSTRCVSLEPNPFYVPRDEDGQSAQLNKKSAEAMWKAISKLATSPGRRHFGFEDRCISFIPRISDLQLMLRVSKYSKIHDYHGAHQRKSWNNVEKQMYNLIHLELHLMLRAAENLIYPQRTGFNPFHASLFHEMMAVLVRGISQTTKALPALLAFTGSEVFFLLKNDEVKVWKKITEEVLEGIFYKEERTPTDRVIATLGGILRRISSYPNLRAMEPFMYFAMIVQASYLVDRLIAGKQMHGFTVPPSVMKVIRDEYSPIHKLIDRSKVCKYIPALEPPEQTPCIIKEFLNASMQEESPDEEEPSSEQQASGRNQVPSQEQASDGQQSTDDEGSENSEQFLDDDILSDEDDFMDYEHPTFSMHDSCCFNCPFKSHPPNLTAVDDNGNATSANATDNNSSNATIDNRGATNSNKRKPPNHRIAKLLDGCKINPSDDGGEATYSLTISRGFFTFNGEKLFMARTGQVFKVES